MQRPLPSVLLRVYVPVGKTASRTGEPRHAALVRIIVPELLLSQSATPLTIFENASGK